MKRIGNLFDAVVEPENLRLAFWKASRGKQHRPDQRAYAARLEEEIEGLRLGLLHGDGPSAEGWKPRDPNAPNPEESVAEALRPLYRDLKRWRNDRAKADGKPAYAIARNVQLAEIVNQAPKSLADLKEVPGIGEAFCQDYCVAVLEIMVGGGEGKDGGKIEGIEGIEKIE